MKPGLHIITAFGGFLLYTKFLYFFRGLDSTGPFVLTILQILKDMSKFMIVMLEHCAWAVRGAE